MGERRGAYRDLLVKPEGRRPHLISRSRWWIILTRIFEKWDVLIWLRIRTGGGLL